MAVDQYERERMWNKIDGFGETLEEVKESVVKIRTYIETKEKQTTKVIAFLGGIAAIIAVVGLVF